MPKPSRDYTRGRTSAAAAGSLAAFGAGQLFMWATTRANRLRAGIGLTCATCSRFGRSQVRICRAAAVARPLHACALLACVAAVVVLLAAGHHTQPPHARLPSALYGGGVAPHPPSMLDWVRSPRFQSPAVPATRPIEPAQRAWGCVTPDGEPPSCQPFDPRMYFGTKAPYALSAGPVGGQAATPLEVHGLRPEAAYVLVRHGTRGPGDINLGTFRQLSQLFKTSPPAQREFQWLAGWAPNLTIDGDPTGKILAEEGYVELSSFGRRLALQLGEVFGSGVASADDVLVTASPYERTRSSAGALVRGLMSTWQPSVGPPHIDGVESRRLNMLHRFHKACPRYKGRVKKNATLHEHIGLAQVLRDGFQRVRASVAATIGLPDFPEDLVEPLWMACMFETGHAVGFRVSRLCEALRAEDFLAMEYLDRVQTFWLKGPAIRINSRIAHGLIKDIWRRLSAVAAVASNPEHAPLDSITDAAGNATRGASTRGNAAPRGVVRVGHAETLLPVIVALELVPASTIRPPCPRDPRGSGWWQGDLTPFAANLVIALLSRPANTTRAPAELFVRVTLNERIVHPRSCASPLCTWEEFSAVLRRAGCSNVLDPATLCELDTPFEPFLDLPRQEYAGGVGMCDRRA